MDIKTPAPLIPVCSELTNGEGKAGLFYQLIQ